MDRELNQKVRNMLLEGDKTIKAIARECGTYYSYVYGVKKSIGAEVISDKRISKPSAFLFACGMGFCGACNSVYILTGRNRHICNECRAEESRRNNARREKARESMSIESGLKVCSKCGESKPISEFGENNNRRAIRKYRRMCLDCDGHVGENNPNYRRPGAGTCRWCGKNLKSGEGVTRCNSGKCYSAMNKAKWRRRSGVMSCLRCRSITYIRPDGEPRNQCGCYDRKRHALPKPTMFYVRYCSVCGKMFHTMNISTKKCSKSCQSLKNAKNKITSNLRRRLREFTKRKWSDIDLYGCSPKELRQHLESQFTDGMDWGNYGVRGWHIDHVKPCASYDLTDDNQIRECFHYTNLQPLWAEDNIRKRDRVVSA
jgi:hypothetical protein